MKSLINKKYTHFAIGKDNKIVNGWETLSDVETLKEFAKLDLIDMDLKPKDYAILSKQTLIKRGIDPFDTNNWYKTSKQEEPEWTEDDDLDPAGGRGLSSHI